MVRALLSVVGRETRGMHRAAYILAGFAFGSQLLALVRDRLLAGAFGASSTLDVYYAAFRVPDLLFATIASLLSLYALLPVISRFKDAEEGYMVSFMRQTLLAFFVAMAGIAGVLYFLVPYLLPLIAPGIERGYQEELAALTRILLLQPILLGASNILAVLTQLRHRFLLYSISPLLYNVGIIVGILVFYPKWGIEGLGWGVVLGALLHVLVQAPFFALERSKSFSWGKFWQPFFEVLRLSVPRTLALAAGQISLLALVALASLFAEGSIAVFMFAWNLQAVPLTIIGVSYSVAAFPTLARLHATGEKKEFISHIESALRHILFWSLPALVLIVVLRAQIVRVVLGAGAFDWDATRLTAAALALFILSLSAQGMTLLIARAYYAAGKTAIPLVLGIFSVVITLFSAWFLVYLFNASPLWRALLEGLFRVSNIGDTTVLMLALSYTVGALLQCGLGLYFFSRDFDVAYRGLSRLFFESMSAAVIGGAVAYGMLVLVGEIVDIDTFVGIFAQGVAGGVVGVGTVACTLLLLRNQEFLETYASFTRRNRAPTPPVAIESTDVSS
jgi:putative peptidoglycan lipid II flippase